MLDSSLASKAHHAIQPAAFVPQMPAIGGGPARLSRLAVSQRTATALPLSSHKPPMESPELRQPNTNSTSLDGGEFQSLGSEEIEELLGSDVVNETVNTPEEVDDTPQAEQQPEDLRSKDLQPRREPNHPNFRPGLVAKFCKTAATESFAGGVSGLMTGLQFSLPSVALTLLMHGGLGSQGEGLVYPKVIIPATIAAGVLSRDLALTPGQGAAIGAAAGGLTMIGRAFMEISATQPEGLSVSAADFLPAVPFIFVAAVAGAIAGGNAWSDGLPH